jgi:ribosomal protein S6
MEKEIDKKEYELAFLLKNRDTESAVETLVKQHGGNIIFKSPVSETRLAYPIKKLQQAYFGYVYFMAMPNEVEKIMHDANLNQALLRVLVITPPVGKGPASLRNARVERTGKKAEEVVAPAAVGGILTNEALEEKLSEILK